MAQAVRVLKAVFTSFNEDKATRLASSISYATIFALAPLIVIIVAIAGAFLSQGINNAHSMAESALLSMVRDHVGEDAATAVADLVNNAFNRPRESFIAQVVGWSTFAIGASNLFASLQDALNSVWRIEQTKGGWKQLLRVRLLSFAMIVVVAFLMLVSFLANAAVTYIGTHYIEEIPIVGTTSTLAIVNGCLLFVVVTVTFAAMFKVLPDVTISWKDVWVGAVTTSVLFLIGEQLLAFYMSVAGIASAYGAAGSLLVALIWIWYSAIILLLGAEFTKVQASGARTRAPTSLRRMTEEPAGVDPRLSA